MHLDKADLLAFFVEVIDYLAQGLAYGAHGDYHTLSIRRAVIVERLVVAAGEGAYLLHIIFDDVGERHVSGVAGLSVLEEYVVILAGVADGGVLRVQGMLSEALNSVPVQHLAQVVVIQHLDLLYLMGGTEAVEEMLHGDAAADGAEMGHCTHIHAFLHAGGRQLCPACLTAGHDIGLIAKNRNAQSCNASGRHMHYAGQLHTCYTVHWRYHQHQALRRRVGAGERTGFQRTLHCAAGAGLCLHLHQLRRLTEQVLFTVGGPLVHMVRHGAGRSYGVDRRNLGKRIRYIRGGFVAVHGLERLFC